MKIRNAFIAIVLLCATSAWAQSPAQYGWFRQALTVDQFCAPYIPVDPAFGGAYFMLGQAGWGTLTFAVSPSTNPVVATFGTNTGDWFTTGNINIPFGAAEFIAPLYSDESQTNPVGQVKICTGQNFGLGNELRSRAIANNTLIVPSPINDCPAGSLERCFQRFFPDTGATRSKAGRLSPDQHVITDWSSDQKLYWSRSSDQK